MTNTELQTTKLAAELLGKQVRLKGLKAGRAFRVEWITEEGRIGLRGFQGEESGEYDPFQFEVTPE